MSVEESKEETVDKASVLAVAYDKMKSISNYKDRVLTVFEVSETFPTMHFMQEVTEIF